MRTGLFGLAKNAQETPFLGGEKEGPKCSVMRFDFSRRDHSQDISHGLGDFLGSFSERAFIETACCRKDSDCLPGTHTSCKPVSARPRRGKSFWQNGEEAINITLPSHRTIGARRLFSVTVSSGTAAKCGKSPSLPPPDLRDPCATPCPDLPKAMLWKLSTEWNAAKPANSSTPGIFL